MKNLMFFKLFKFFNSFNNFRVKKAMFVFLIFGLGIGVGLRGMFEQPSPPSSFGGEEEEQFTSFTPPSSTETPSKPRFIYKKELLEEVAPGAIGEELEEQERLLSEVPVFPQPQPQLTTEITDKILNLTQKVTKLTEETMMDMPNKKQGEQAYNLWVDFTKLANEPQLESFPLLKNQIYILREQANALRQPTFTNLRLTISNLMSSAFWWNFTKDQWQKLFSNIFNESQLKTMHDQIKKMVKLVNFRIKHSAKLQEKAFKGLKEWKEEETPPSPRIDIPSPYPTHPTPLTTPSILPPPPRFPSAPPSTLPIRAILPQDLANALIPLEQANARLKIQQHIGRDGSKIDPRYATPQVLRALQTKINQRPKDMMRFSAVARELAKGKLTEDQIIKMINAIE